MADSSTAVVAAQATAVASEQLQPAWLNLCGLLAPMASMIVFLAPYPTIRRVAAEGTVGHLPLLPYTSMMASTLLWITYGVLRKERKIWLTNGVGLALATSYFISFTQYAPKASATLPGSVRQHLQAVVAVAVVQLLIVWNPLISSPANVIGTTAVGFCIAMFASPLAALQTVIQTKSAKAIPLPFTLASIVNCLLWSILGIVEMKDVNIYLPNLLGLFFSLCQAVLKLIYGDGKKASYGKQELLPT